MKNDNSKFYNDMVKAYNNAQKYFDIVPVIQTLKQQKAQNEKLYYNPQKDKEFLTTIVDGNKFKQVFNQNKYNKYRDVMEHFYFLKDYISSDRNAVAFSKWPFGKSKKLKQYNEKLEELINLHNYFMPTYEKELASQQAKIDNENIDSTLNKLHEMFLDDEVYGMMRINPQYINIDATKEGIPTKSELAQSIARCQVKFKKEQSKQKDKEAELTL